MQGGLKLCCKKQMNANDVLAFYRLAFEVGINIWIDGGWGVDSLLEKETRPHADLDIVVQAKDLTRLVGLLKLRGFIDVPRDDTSDWNFVLGDDKGHEIDFHVITIDAQGNGIYGPKENGSMYPASALTGIGRISGQGVRCISAEDLVKFHSGYQLDETDYRDVSALCEKFGIEMPKEFDNFKSGDE
jgi:lincosamide nucleotidyltransferase A/C/D/E